MNDMMTWRENRKRENDAALNCINQKCDKMENMYMDRLFEDMILDNVKCVFAYCTPSRPDSNRPGAVMTVMRCPP